MNRKQKLIISITGITIVALALLGITYGYYLTRIQGNTNSNSISITTADLKLVYSENSPEIVTENNIMPGTTIGEKTFTVSNTGNSAVEDYKVVLEYAVIENVVPSVFVRPQDFEITLTCKAKNIETDVETGTCSGYTGTWNNESFEMTTNDIADNIKHEYTLTIFYANPDIDQSDDMGKNLNLKVQIYGANETSTITGIIDNVDETYAMKLNSNPKISTIKNVGTKENPKYQYKFIGVEPNKDGESHTLTLVNKSNVEQSTGNITIKKGTTGNIDGSTITFKDNQTNIYLTTGSGSSTLTNTATFNPYDNNTNTLAYHIINNAITNKNGTLLVDTPPTKVAEETSYTKSTGEMLNITVEIASYNWFYGETKRNAQENGIKVTSCTEDIIGMWLYDSEGYFDDEETIDLIQVSGCDGDKPMYSQEVLLYEKTLGTTQDNYGISYYYRGDIEDNYVTFADKCWRIVRIQGDGSVKLTLYNGDAGCSENLQANYSIGGADWGYKYDNGKRIGDYKNSTTGMRSKLNVWLDMYISPIKKSVLKVDEWCIGNMTNAYDNNKPYLLLETSIFENYANGVGFYYETGKNLYGLGVNPNASLKCTGEIDNSKIGVLTADEVVFAGGKVDVANNNYYLAKGGDYFWTLSYSKYSGNKDVVFAMSGDGTVGGSDVHNSDDYYGVRPAISLLSNVNITSGDGTKTNPYVIAD